MSSTDHWNLQRTNLPGFVTFGGAVVPVVCSHCWCWEWWCRWLHACCGCWELFVCWLVVACWSVVCFFLLDFSIQLSIPGGDEPLRAFLILYSPLSTTISTHETFCCCFCCLKDFSQTTALTSPGWTTWFMVGDNTERYEDHARWMNTIFHDLMISHVSSISHPCIAVIGWYTWGQSNTILASSIQPRVLSCLNIVSLLLMQTSNIMPIMPIALRVIDNLPITCFVSCDLWVKMWMSINGTWYHRRGLWIIRHDISVIVWCLVMIIILTRWYLH